MPWPNHFFLAYYEICSCSLTDGLNKKVLTLLLWLSKKRSLAKQLKNTLDILVFSRMEPTSRLMESRNSLCLCVNFLFIKKKKLATFSIWLGGAAVDACGVLFLIFCFSLPQVSSCLALTFSTYENLTWGSLRKYNLNSLVFVFG